MSTALTTQEPVSAETLEHVLGTGDLSKLSTAQRVEYYRKTCELLGLNPLTRPMRFLAFQGGIQLYFTKDGSDQLRKKHNINLRIVDRAAEAGVYTVTVRANDKHGREDEDIGSVVLPSSGESRANALMKATTKAKRRVTLSICGLGFPDESELDTMPGAQTFDPEDEVPVARIRKTEPPAPREPGWQIWIDKLQAALVPLATEAAVAELEARPTIKTGMDRAPEWAKEEALAMFAEARAQCRIYEQSEIGGAADEPPPVKGEDKAASG